MEKTAKNECLRCSGTMKSIGTQEIQLGRASFIFGALGNLAAGSLEVDIYVCSGCGRVEFYAAPEVIPAIDGTYEHDPDTVMCPRCEEIHDIGLTSCPKCGYNHRPLFF